MGHQRPIAFFKPAAILPTYLFLKPAQGGLSQMSCFIVFFSVGLTQRDKIYQQISCQWTFSTCGCTLAPLQATQARETLLQTISLSCVGTQKASSALVLYFILFLLPIRAGFKDRPKTKCENIRS